MRSWKIGKFMATAAIALGVSSAAQAMTNLALSANGATFVSGSSHISGNGYKVNVAENNLLTDTPTVDYYNGDIRYIFAQDDGNEDLIIRLDAVHLISSFAVTFSATDRTPKGLTVSVSNDGVFFSDAVITDTAINHGREFALNVVPVSAQYIKYNFARPFNVLEGTGIRQLFAGSSVPEPTTWTLMLVGFGATGIMLRARRKVLSAI